MALTLGDIITAARHRSPWFHKQRGTPDPVIGGRLGEYQNELIAMACLRDKHFLSQTATILLQLRSGDPVSLAGAGADDGLPGAVTDNIISSVPAVAARLVEAGLILEDGATVVLANTVATSADVTSLTKTGAARTTDADQELVLYIARGTGSGQARYILSNTAETWVISDGTDGLGWLVVPDATSVFSIVDPNYAADGSANIALTIPATKARAAYLVRLADDGTPYIDLTAPLVATIDSGVTLPSAAGISAARVRGADGCAEPLEIVSRSRRDDADYWPSIYVVANTVYFCGRAEDWAGITQLELEYVPVAPPFSRPADFFLLPDAARSTLVAMAAAELAQRASELPNCPVKPVSYIAAAADAEEKFLASLQLSKRARRVTMGGDTSYA